jgi:hypothetical protein
LRLIRLIWCIFPRTLLLIAIHFTSGSGNSALHQQCVAYRNVPAGKLLYFADQQSRMD